MYPHGSSHQQTTAATHALFHKHPNNSHISTRITTPTITTHTHTTHAPDKPISPHHEHRKPSTFSTGQLHALPRLHPPPIKLVVSQRSYLVKPMGNLVSGKASRLDAFSGYPNRRSLLSYATGAATDTRALRPCRSSRTRHSSPQIPNAHSG